MDLVRPRAGLDLSEKPRKTVIILDDDPELPLYLAAALNPDGYDVQVARDSDDAFAIAHQRFDGKIDLFIVDVFLPGMDGRRLAQWMSGAYPDTHILFISGHPEKALIDSSVLGSRAAFLAKPFTGSELLRSVRQLLGSPAVI